MTHLDIRLPFRYICHRIISPEKGRCRGGKPRRRGERRSPRAGLHPAPRAIRASCLPALRPACGVRRWKWGDCRRSDPRPLDDLSHEAWPGSHTCGGSEVRIIIAACLVMRTSEPKPHAIDKLLVSFRFRSSQLTVPHHHANFGIGTLGTTHPLGRAEVERRQASAPDSGGAAQAALTVARAAPVWCGTDDSATAGDPLPSFYFVVIASGAKQSSLEVRSGLLPRFRSTQ